MKENKLQMKQDDNTIRCNAKFLRVVSKTINATMLELFQKHNQEEKCQNKKVNVARQNV